MAVGEEKGVVCGKSVGNGDALADEAVVDDSARVYATVLDHEVLGLHAVAYVCKFLARSGIVDDGTVAQRCRALDTDVIVYVHVYDRTAADDAHVPADGLRG